VLVLFDLTIHMLLAPFETERVAELESINKDLEVQLTEQGENANRVIAKWQESCNALEEKNAQLLGALESCGVGEEGVISQEALTALQERLRDTERSLAKAREDMKEDDDAVLRWQGMCFVASSRVWDVGPPCCVAHGMKHLSSTSRAGGATRISRGGICVTG
jgi:hypothetical protein